ncbi:serine hydrolase [Staphylococcus equorum]|uniref:serine hydrolase n=1 Tax=Staphylococcus equorum TaxID=246432 RepID=UPI003EB81BDF
MLKKISKIKLSIFLFIIIIMIIVIVTLLGILSLNKKDPEFIADYLNENPEKSGLVISKNDKNIYTHNPELKLPTASLFKIIVGIELVNQYESNKIDLHEKVKISDVNKYNMTPKTNSSFIKWKKDKVKNQKTVSLYEIAKGMIQYSSNPNTDYLIDRLGNENVNNSAKKLTNNKHEKITKIYPRVIAPLYLHKVKGNNTEEVADTISKMKPTEYDKVTNRTQDALKHSKFTKEELNNYFPSEKEQVNLSNNLPKSTAQSYINILNGIENYTHNKKSQKILYNLLTIDTHSGNNVLGKNGYTINISNKAITTEQGKNKYTIVLLTSKQNSYEHEKIEKNIEFFIDDILNNKYRLIDK